MKRIFTNGMMSWEYDEALANTLPEEMRVSVKTGEGKPAKGKEKKEKANSDRGSEKE